MKQFNNLMEAVAYHRQCCLCNGIMVHGLKIEFDLKKHPGFKWNLSENVDSETDDWVTIDIYTNEITYYEQSRRYDEELFHGTDGPYNLRYKKVSYTGYSGTMYESLRVACGSCRNFSYTIQVVMDLTAKKLTGIFLNDEFIRHEDANRHIHDIRNAYVIEKTEYTYYKESTSEDDSTKRTISIPLISMNLKNPADTVAKIKKLVIFS